MCLRVVIKVPRKNYGARVERRIKVDLINIDRHPIDPATFKLAEFIKYQLPKRAGHLPAIHVARLADGRFKLLDGRHRVTAYKLLGRKTILARYSLTIYTPKNKEVPIETNP
jgi:hypothetical protein